MAGSGPGTDWLDRGLGNDILLDAGEGGTLLECSRDDLLVTDLAWTTDAAPPCQGGTRRWKAGSPVGTKRQG